MKTNKKCLSLSQKFHNMELIRSVAGNLITWLFAAGMNILIATAAQASVIYTDIADTLVEQTTAFFDVNGDGVNNFSLYNTYTEYYPTSGGMYFDGYLGAYSASTGGVSYAGAFGFAYASNSGAVIGPAMSFEGEIMADSNPPYPPGGEWGNAIGPMYLGFLFIVQSQPHYGWARISIADYEKMSAIVHDFAYESIPNTAIVAGEMPAAVPLPASLLLLISGMTQLYLLARAGIKRKK